MMKKQQPALVLCERTEAFNETVTNFVDNLQEVAHTIGNHGLTKEQFWESGIFRGAMERIRGTQSATMANKKDFMSAILEYLQQNKVIEKWDFSGAGERHDYEILLKDGWNTIIETKGCLDGNNTNIFERPPQADEFIIWSLCQNSASDPRYNAWSGIHTRLGAEIIHRRQLVDGVVIWDMLCGTTGRPCPKIKQNPSRLTKVDGFCVPPPCLFLMPRSVPNARNNSQPSTKKLDDMPFMKALFSVFKCNLSDIVEVSIAARMKESSVQRQTTFYRLNKEIKQSKWTPIKRAN